VVSQRVKTRRLVGQLTRFLPGARILANLVGFILIFFAYAVIN